MMAQLDEVARPHIGSQGADEPPRERLHRIGEYDRDSVFAKGVEDNALPRRVDELPASIGNFDGAANARTVGVGQGFAAGAGLGRLVLPIFIKRLISLEPSRANVDRIADGEAGLEAVILDADKPLLLRHLIASAAQIGQALPAVLVDGRAIAATDELVGGKVQDRMRAAGVDLVL
jgi:hypothetical protein